MIIFVASYATGLGNVPWQQGELFSLEGMLLALLVCSQSHILTLVEVRGIGTSCATAMNWAAL